MNGYKDCANCAARDTCEDRSDGDFCTEWRSEAPRAGRSDPDPGGWLPED